jgi:hypothetical protein
MPEVLVPIPVPSATALKVPWRDPRSVSPEDLKSYLVRLERACLENPRSAELRTLLGITHAVNYDVYKSMDALEAARAIDPSNFWAQLKFAELHYRLRVLSRAETETLRAMDLAENGWQLAIARHQLQEIRKLARDSTRNVTWDKPLTAPVLLLLGMMVAIFAIMLWP